MDSLAFDAEHKSPSTVLHVLGAVFGLTLGLCTVAVMGAWQNGSRRSDHTARVRRDSFPPSWQVRTEHLIYIVSTAGEAARVEEAEAEARVNVAADSSLLPHRHSYSIWDASQPDVPESIARILEAGGAALLGARVRLIDLTGSAWAAWPSALRQETNVVSD
jgi:hypothetical protein